MSAKRQARRQGRAVRVLTTPEGVPTSKVRPGQTGVLAFYSRKEGWCVRLDGVSLYCTFLPSEIEVISQEDRRHA